MSKKKTILLPKAEKILSRLGENIRLARLRRKLSTEQVSERANIGRSTLWKIEEGKGSVSMGNYLQVLLVLGLEKDILTVANDDVLGRKIQDVNMIVKERAPKKTSNE